MRERVVGICGRVRPERVAGKDWGENRLAMGVALTEALNWTGTRVVSELLDAI